MTALAVSASYPNMFPAACVPESTLPTSVIVPQLPPDAAQPVTAVPLDFAPAAAAGKLVALLVKL